ncbi:hypothetical protein [Clostridium gasigenes]|uniref:Uncharacterized protein n=1 Tax=Clostridium gasigenes TaxID=94869 RepID=A0A1H0S1S8_9CLOT|nr:hypothetical protein [Clostridium gasigenes]SDP35575.1 hypothetical protein SAMN04488529_104116 [Clostridium gasigenes]
MYMKINDGMIGYFIFGLNAIIDAGESISIAEASELIENNKLIKTLQEKYNKYWDWDVLEKYDDNIHVRLTDYIHYIESDSYRKFGIENNGFLIISSVATQIIVNGDRK